MRSLSDILDLIVEAQALDAEVWGRFVEAHERDSVMEFLIEQTPETVDKIEALTDAIQQTGVLFCDTMVSSVAEFREFWERKPSTATDES